MAIFLLGGGSLHRASVNGLDKKLTFAKKTHMTEGRREPSNGAHEI